MEKIDILIIGSLAGFDLMFAEYLSRNGLKCRVLRPKNPSNPNNGILSPISSINTSYPIEKIIYYENSKEFLNYAKKSRLILSITGSLIRALGRYWLCYKFLNLPPVIHVSTGSDIAELPKKYSIIGIVYRQYLHFVKINCCLPYPYVIKQIYSEKIPHIFFMRYPFYLISENKMITKSQKENTIIFFHASHLDWKVNDPGKHRHSAKGNDRFIRAFAKAVKSGLPAKCIILDRGPDREIAKKLIQDLSVECHFIWKPHLSRDELVNEYFNSDVIVDQFDLGGFGGIAIEAMSVEKPVMIYIERTCARLLYPEDPPVLNCHSEEEIYEQIMKCADRQFLERLGKEAREWVYKYHNWETCLDQFIFYYTLLTGHQIQDYGWERNPYKKDKSAGELV